MIYEFAPAKLNLYLHITGRRADGYHDLDSLVAFAGVGDEVRLEPAETFSVIIEGPQAAALKTEDASHNLVVKAAHSLATLVSKPLNVTLALVKNLPVASGIGGGSSDAAAALRALAKHWGIDVADPRLAQAAAQHGQDVPACLKIESNYLTATGTAPGPLLPYADIVMVNPNKALATPSVYQTYRDGAQDFSPHAVLTEAPKDLETLVMLLKERRNDLEESAAQLMPEIPVIIGDLSNNEGCLFARMSGSGATCFGIFADRNTARNTAAALLKKNPNWWVVQSYIPCRSDPRKS